MNIKIQISLVLIAIATLAYFDQIPLPEISQRGISIQNHSKKELISDHSRTSQLSVGIRPSNNERQPTAVSSEVRAVPEQNLAVKTRQDFSSNEEFKIERDLDLREDIQKDLLFLFSINQREKDFLLNEVRVTPEKYQKILNQKKIVQWQLSQAPQYAKARGYRVQDVKKSILSRHIYWMQSTIGVGYYNRLQEISIAE